MRRLLALCLALLLVPTAWAQSSSQTDAPQNVILLIPDGFGPASSTMARDYLRWKHGTTTLALDTLERAFLKTTEDGNEWWRVRGIQDGETWVYEALLDPSTSEVRRLRSRDPNGEVGEVPVTEETVYQPPQRLTEESIEGATEGTEEITTPAGTYTARRVEYQGQMGSGAVTWHLSDEVPGHVVRYQIEGDGEQPWTSTLIDMGTDASTLLNAY